MVDLYLIRHAESVLNENGKIIGGKTNSAPLTDLGIKQSHLLGHRLKKDGIKFDAVHSSIAVRAISTAKIVCEILGIPAEEIIQSEATTELSQGDWEGRIREEVYTPKLLATMNKLQPDFRAPNGESQREAELRMRRYISENFLFKFPYKKRIFALFTHGMVEKCLLRGVLDSAPRMTHRFAIDNTSITRLIFDEKGWGIISINDTCHLR